jgi:hypothetical protein
MSDEMMAEYQKLVAKGLDTDKAVEELQKGSRIEDIPDRGKEWLINNNERLMGWKILLYFYRDNKEFIITNVIKSI